MKYSSLTTNPTKICFTLSALHMITTLISFYTSMALWAFSRNFLVKIFLQRSHRGLTRFVFMPLIMTVSAKFMSFWTNKFCFLCNCLIYSYYRITVWMRAPFVIRVFFLIFIKLSLLCQINILLVEIER